MATRMYFNSTDAAPITPSTFNANWGTTASAIVRPFSSTNGTSTLTTKTYLNSANDLSDFLMYQFVSPPMAATTLTGTFKMIMRVVGTQSASWFVGWASLRVMNQAGTSVTSTPFTPALIGATARFARITPATILTPDGGGTHTLTSSTVNENDRLILEVGFENQNTSTDDVDFRVGESGASDFAYTAGLTTDLDPWCEFSQTITFNAEGGGASTLRQLMLTGCGT